MSLVDRNEVIRVLRGYNKWWVTGRVPNGSVPQLRRASYWEARKLLAGNDVRRAIVLSGPRRVGKTTISFQLINSLLVDDEVDPRNVIYLTLEHPMLKLMTLDEILDLYDEEIASEKGRRYVFLDELQYHADPVTWLKIMVDKHRDWRFVATGSASITFKKKDRESGVGRMVTVPVSTFSFYEYLQLRKYEQDVFSDPDIPNDIAPTQVGFLPARERLDILSKLKPLQKEFGRYLLQGGFPETALTNDLYLAQRILREDIVDKVLKRDMAAFYKIRKLAELERLFIYMCLNNGAIMNVDTVSRELGVKRPTVNSFLDAFEGAHLARQIKLFSVSGKKFLKGKSKWYAVDASMRNAVLLRGEEVLTDETEMGAAVIESAVINHLATYSYGATPRLGYWKNSKAKEVDLIVDVPQKKNVAVEVKYRQHVHLSGDEGIYSYLSGNRDAVGVVVCKDAEDFDIRKMVIDGVDTSVTLMPAYAFLYLLGKHEYERVVLA